MSIVYSGAWCLHEITLMGVNDISGEQLNMCKQILILDLGSY